MPDNQDYEDLTSLLAEPEGWIADEAARARGLLARQRQALAAAHPKDERLQQRMREVAAKMETAVARYESSEESAIERD